MDSVPYIGLECEAIEVCCWQQNFCPELYKQVVLAGGTGRWYWQMVLEDGTGRWYWQVVLAVQDSNFRNSRCSVL